MVKCINRSIAANGLPLLPFFIQPGEPLEPGPRGINLRILVRSSQTNYQYSCVELVMSPKKMGPAPHFHSHLDEITFVLEGKLGVMVGDTEEEIDAGGFNLRPHGIIHSLWNASDKPLRIFEMYCNQNFDDYLEELFFNIIPDMMKHNLSAADHGIAKRSMDLHAEFGVTLFPELRKPIIDKYGLVS